MVKSFKGDICKNDVGESFLFMVNKGIFLDKNLLALRKLAEESSMHLC